MTFLPSQSKMCEQEHMLIIAYGFWGTLKDMSLGVGIVIVMSKRKYKSWNSSIFFEKLSVYSLSIFYFYRFPMWCIIKCLFPLFSKNGNRFFIS